MTHEEEHIFETALISGIGRFSKNQDALARIVRAATELLSAFNTGQEIPDLNEEMAKIIGYKS